MVTYQEQNRLSDAKNIPYFVSWSGGKDSCMALFRVMQQYGLCQWVDKICQKAGIIAYEPLWNDTQENISQQLLDEKFQAKIIAVNHNYLNQNHLGKII